MKEWAGLARGLERSGGKDWTDGVLLKMSVTQSHGSHHATGWRGQDDSACRVKDERIGGDSNLATDA